MPSIEAIVATDEYGGFSKNNQIPWYIKKDLQAFRRITTKTKEKHQTNIVMMGRKTFESMGCRLLPNRINIVLTRNPESLQKQPDFTFSSLEEAIEYSKNLSMVSTVFLIGGEEVYRHGISNYHVEKIYRTVVHGDYHCDRFFPVIEYRYRRIFSTLPEKESEHTFHFEVWEKKM